MSAWRCAGDAPDLVTVFAGIDGASLVASLDAADLRELDNWEAGRTPAPAGTIGRLAAFLGAGGALDAVCRAAVGRVVWRAVASTPRDPWDADAPAGGA